MIHGPFRQIPEQLFSMGVNHIHALICSSHRDSNFGSFVCLFVLPPPRSSPFILPLAMIIIIIVVVVVPSPSTPTSSSCSFFLLFYSISRFTCEFTKARSRTRVTTAPRHSAKRATAMSTSASTPVKDLTSATHAARASDNFRSFAVTWPPSTTRKLLPPVDGCLE